MPEAARELAEAGAAYAGRPEGSGPNPATQGDVQEGVEQRSEGEAEDAPRSRRTKH